MIKRSYHDDNEDVLCMIERVCYDGQEGVSDQHLPRAHRSGATWKSAVLVAIDVVVIAVAVVV